MSDHLEILRGRIRKRLAELNISEREASRQIGRNECYVRDLLNGRSKHPELSGLVSLSKALGVNLLCGMTDDLPDPDDARAEGAFADQA
ncbi:MULTISPECIES: helix-turn-helix transcriptional regulator [Phenylobacterium]|uniref:Transcriptional regulator with XRE-family HTH domain n=1 Tax=Phenylobacterium koreense TaxID=266125 RepID=A0ABV2EFZ6_9CAUL